MKPEGMTFIAENPVHVVVRSEIPALHDTAGRQVSPSQRRLYAKFKVNEAPVWAYEEAIKRYEFFNQPDVTPHRRMGFYDSRQAQLEHGWTDDELALIEQKLLTSASCIRVEPPRISAPWPAYDKLVVHGRRTIDHVAEKIVETVTETGLDVETVAAYERQNLNRPEVLAALAALTAEPETEEVQEVVA